VNVTFRGETTHLSGEALRDSLAVVNPRSGKSFQLLCGNPNRPVVRVQYPPVLGNERLNGYRFWWRKREIIKNPTVGYNRHLVLVPARCFQSLRQGAFTIRVFVLAELQKIRFLYNAGQSQPFSTGPKPLTEHLMLLAIIIAKLQMLREIFFRVAEIALCLDGQHAQFLLQPVWQGCNDFITNPAFKCVVGIRTASADKFFICFTRYRERIAPLKPTFHKTQSFLGRPKI